MPSLTPLDGSGGGRIHSDKPLCNANTNFWCTLKSYCIGDTWNADTQLCCFDVCFKPFDLQCWPNFNESDLQSPLQPFSSRHAMLLPNKLRSVVVMREKPRPAFFKVSHPHEFQTQLLHNIDWIKGRRTWKKRNNNTQNCFKRTYRKLPVAANVKRGNYCRGPSL